jgi:hypothetical protein
LYPLYPSDVTLPFNLTSETYESLKLSNIPHVFIAPSYLQPMVKIVAGSIVINPGRLTRGDKMGTYATISIDLESIAASNPDEQQSSIAPYSEVQLLAAIWKDLE